ncbi:uncharacterized protein ACBT44_004954 [Syngnathus typhle]
MAAVYIPPHARASEATQMLADQGEPRTRTPQIQTARNVSHQRGTDDFYTVIKDAYHSAARAALGLSDHCLVHLIPAYRQKLKTSKPVVRTVRKWTVESGPEMDRPHRLSPEEGPAEGVLPETAQEVQPAARASEDLLHCHHPVCPLHLHHCLVWIGLQAQTATDNQDCRKDHWNQPPIYQRLVPGPGNMQGTSLQTLLTQVAVCLNYSPPDGVTELGTPKPADTETASSPRLLL